MLGSFLTQTKNQDFSIEQRRGIEYTDLNDRLVLVRSPIEQVGQALSQTLQIIRWERDVYERSIELVNQSSFIIFQFQRHPWTVIQSSSFFPHRILFHDEEAQSLSHWLHTKAIHYLVSDTGGYIGYHLFNCGESLEKLYKEPMEEPIEEPIEETDAFKDEDEMEFQGVCQFQSQLRQLETNEIKDGDIFTDEFLRKQDAYVPTFIWKRHFKAGQKVTIRLEGLERDNFERMDYMALI